MRLKFNADTKLYFLIGDPMEHSCTGFVNNGMFEAVRENAVLIPRTVKKEHLSEFLAAAKLMGANGIYLTMPHKSDIIEHLDECDEMSRAFHSANHIRIEPDGRLVGIGLDGMGMGETIQKSVSDLRSRKVLLLGAGSVAGAIAADLCVRGVMNFCIANRTVEKAEAIAKILRRFFPDVAVACGPLNDAFLECKAKDADVAMQCTSLGILAPGYEDFSSLAFMEKLPKHCFAVDVLYPTSSFLAKAQELGLKNESGVMMTIHQQRGIMKFQFGKDITDDVLLDAEENFRIALTMRDVRMERLKKQRDEGGAQ